MKVNKKTITPNSNTTKSKTTPTIIDEYYDMHLFKHRPVTDNFLDNLAEKYTLWFKEHPEALLFTQFLQDQNITRTDFYRWLLRSTKLQKAHDFVIMMLCNRREVGAITRKFDSNTILKMHGHYSDIYVSETTRVAALGNQEQKTGNITVVIPPFGAQE